MNAADGSGMGDWTDAYEKAKKMVDEMTLDEKVRLATVQTMLRT